MDIWRLAKPRLKTPLISTSNEPALEQLCSALPVFGDLGLEIRLAPGEQPIDVCQQYDGPRFAGALAMATDASTPSRCIRTIAQGWERMDDPLRETIHKVWLEFDASVDDDNRVADPGIFIELKNGCQLSASQWQTVLGELLEAPAARETLKRQWCLGGQATGKIAIAGAMPSRTPFECKTNRRIQPVEMSQLTADAIGRDLAVRMTRFLSRNDPSSLLCDQLMTHQPPARTGFDIAWFKSDDKTAPSRFLDLLVEEGLCCPRKREALNHFPFTVTPGSASAPWPDVWVAESIQRPGNEFSCMRGFLHHFKLVFSQNAAPSAKVYLGFVHDFETL